MTRKKTLMNGMLTVDMEKFEDNLTVITYGALFFVNKILIIASVIMGFGVIMSGGDGKYSDGNIGITMTCLAACIMCGLGAKIVTLTMETIVAKTKARKKR